MEARAAIRARGGPAAAALSRLGGKPASDRALFVVVALGFIVVAAGAVGSFGDMPLAENFTVVFASIVIEALPFILVGALVSAAIEVFVSDRAFDRIGRLPAQLQVPGAVLGGFAFPVCECGSVPVARRLILRGVHPAAGLAFMLASPVLNPIVLLSTYVAYQGTAGLEMVGARAALGVTVAAVAAVAIGERGATLLRPRARSADLEPHSHGPGESTLQRLVGHLSADFLFMGKFVVAGAALAAALQTLVPQSFFAGILTSPMVGAVLMMGVAFLLSLCSEADAFVAVSFTDFPLNAQLAFLTFGPVLDIKLALLYAATFGAAFVLRLGMIVSLTVFIGSSIALLLLP